MITNEVLLTVVLVDHDYFSGDFVDGFIWTNKSSLLVFYAVDYKMQILGAVFDV